MKTNKLIDFKFLKDIIYYDGPIISLGITQENIPVLEIWCNVDYDKKINFYAYAFIKEEDLIPFINAEKSYFNVLKDSEEIIFFKYNGENAFDFEVVNNIQFINDYGPKEDSDLSLDLQDFRVFFEEYKNNKE